MTNDEATCAYYQAMLGANTNPTEAPQSPSGPSSMADKARAYLVPLHERLRDALTKIPPDILAEGLRLEVIWPLVSGRQRTKPRAYEVADALRRLGWIRIRFYSDMTAPSGNYWFPPNVAQEDAKANLRRQRGAQ
jgi:hypothetical protein